MGRCPRARQRIPPRELAVLQRWWRALRRSTAQITSLPVPESLMVATPAGNASNFSQSFEQTIEQT